jgi:hypothetical protein
MLFSANGGKRVVPSDRMWLIKRRESNAAFAVCGLRFAHAILAGRSDPESCTLHLQPPTCR